jgi:hypothetical protein
MNIKMHGLSLTGSGEPAETDVHPDNIEAFKASGWKIGELPKKISDDDIKSLNEEPEVVAAKQCAFIKDDGEQCGNKTKGDSDFCFLKTHK